MRQIINGKRYDTETARLLATDHGGGYGPSDFHFWEEGLYRTPAGQFFTAGSGGPFSAYGRPGPGQNERHGSCKIRLLTEPEARRWMEQHGTDEEYEAAFSVEEG